MNIKILSLTSIFALLCVTSPLVLKAADGPADAAAYAQVWKNREDWRNFTSEQMMLYADILLEKAKDPNEDLQSKFSDLVFGLANKCSLDECHSVDAKLCKYDVRRAVSFWPAFPKTAEHYQALHPDTFTEATWRYLKALPRVDYNYDVYNRNCGQDLAAQLYYYNHKVVTEYDINFATLQWTLSQGVADYVKTHGGIEAYERRKVNPYTELSEKIHRVQNSRRLQGIAELYRDYGGVEWIDPVWPSDAEITALMNDCISGKTSLGVNGRPSKDACVLMLYLGVDAYNEFVKRYNIHASGAFERDAKKTPAAPTYTYCDVIECAHKRWGHNFEFASKSEYAAGFREEARKAGDTAAVKKYTDIITKILLQDLRSGYDWVDDPELAD
jgi:hypothetical protein